jgi:hypothetical protein
VSVDQFKNDQSSSKSEDSSKEGEPKNEEGKVPEKKEEIQSEFSAMKQEELMKQSVL